MPSQSPQHTETYSLEKAEEDIAVLRGQVQILTEAHTQQDTDLVPNTPAAGHSQFSSTGQQKYAGADGTAYNTGRLSLHISGNQQFTTTSAVDIAGMTGLSVAAIKYRIHGKLTCTQDTAAVTQRLGWRGTLASGTRISCHMIPAIGAGGTNVWVEEVVSNAAVTIPAFATANHFRIDIDGVVVFTAPDSFGLTGWQGTAGDKWTVLAGSYVDLLPMT